MQVKTNPTEITTVNKEKTKERLTLYVKGVMEITVKNETKGGNSHDESARV